ncbi:hypothetical protein [Nesterenkonia sandarakina]|uniref:Outer membrane murein-binding lipoprotein Lpp n=1 Tax=Nesterenkonia sandarakina TaxID=272918 RepID=A0A7Z0EAR4_9MICC|nr:hypothetical protein [Nesterenkonia sandarakina]NYJ18165.1 outer membrane murein-binding lipoprotein Lpp [Nesterenkonia sandarakina]
MKTKSSKAVTGAFPILAVLLVATSCSAAASDTTFEDVADLSSSVESAGHECNAMTSTTYDLGEQAMCAEGHSLTVWDEEADPGELGEDDALVQEMEEQDLIEHLRGANWHVMSVDGDLLDEMQQNYGGQRNEEGVPDLND